MPNPVVVCLIRPTDLSGRLGGGLKRFVEVASRIHTNGVKYVIIESEPFLKSFPFFEKAKELAEVHKIVSLRLPWRISVYKPKIGPISFWLKLIPTVFLLIGAIKSSSASLVLAPGETFPEVLVAWLSRKITGRAGAIIVQSDPFLPIRGYDVKGFKSLYAAYRNIRHPVVAFLEALVAKFRIGVMNDMSLLIVSRHLMRLLEARGITGIVRVSVTNGVDLEAISMTPASDLHSDAIFIGRIAHSKGIADLVRAWTEHREQRQQYSLTLAGPIEEGLREEINSLANSHNRIVRVLGPLTDRQVISVLKSSRVLVLPSHFESFPLISAEALACGIPVATYDSPWIREFLPTPAVATVPLRDPEALARRARAILEDNQERVRLGKIGTEFVARYQWSKVATDEARAYRLLAQNVTARHMTCNDRPLRLLLKGYSPFSCESQLWQPLARSTSST